MSKVGFISPKLAALIIKGVTTGNQGRTHLIYWDENSERWKRRTDAISVGVWHGFAIFTAFYNAFFSARTAQVRIDTDAPLESKLLMLFGTVFYMFPVVFETSLLLYGDEITSYLNNCFRLFQDFSEHSPGVTSKGKKCLTEVWIVEMFLTFTYYGFWALHMVTGLISILKPDLDIFFSSLFIHVHSSWAWNQIHLLSVCAVHIVGQVYMTGGFLYIFASAGTFFPLIAVIESLKNKKNLNGLSGRESFLYFQQIVLITDKFNRIFG